MAAGTQVQRSAPQAPVSAPLSDKAVSDFMQLKKSLSNITSWELALGGPEEILPMFFSEAGNGEQAQLFASVLK